MDRETSWTKIRSWIEKLRGERILRGQIEKSKEKTKRVRWSKEEVTVENELGREVPAGNEVAREIGAIAHERRHQHDRDRVREEHHQQGDTGHST